MSNRRADPRQHAHESALRTALQMAVGSLEPGADGLDQIRAKIAAKQPARRRLGWWTVAALGRAWSWWRDLLPPQGWFLAMLGAVVERFRPDQNRAGWFIWLRPAAAVTTGLFVVTAASWAVAALPSAISPSRNVKVYHTPTPPPKHKTSATGRHQTSYTSPGGGGGTTPYGHGSSGSTGPATPTCSPTASNSSQPPSSPPPSSSVSDSGSPTPTDSGSSSSSASTPPTSAGTTPADNTPSSSPTVSGGTAPSPALAGGPVPAVSPEATGKALLTPDAVSARQLAGVTGLAGAAPDVTDSPPAPTDAPQPTASPTVSGPAPPFPTSTPLPPAPC